MIKKNFIIILLFFVVFLTACGGDTSSKVLEVSKLDQRIVFGVAQKGPAIEGSVVLIYELDSKAERTGKKLHTTTSGKQGSFGFKLPSSWGEAVEVVFSGRYFNEVTGDISTDTVSLSTIVLLQDATQVSANINVLNTMIAARVRSLLRKSKLSFQEAVLSASTSIKNITGISGQRVNTVDITKDGSTEDSAIVLFLSGIVIDLAKKYQKPTQQIINQLASNFAIDGQLSGMAEKWETRLKDLALNRERIYTDKYSSRLSRYLGVTAKVPTSASLPDAITLTSRPIAKIEANLSVEPNTTVILDGSKSESTNNKPVKFTWFQTDHGNERLELKNRFESKVKFDVPNKENITMQLTLVLKDSDGMTGSKTVRLTTAKIKPSIDDFVVVDKQGSTVKNTIFVNEGSTSSVKLKVNNPAGGEISYKLNAAPSYGEVLFPFVSTERLSKAGTHSVNVRYTHNGSEENADTFVLEVVDELGNIGTLRIDVIISPVNDPPNARDDLFRVTAGETLKGNVLDDNANGADFDEEGDELSVRRVIKEGELSLGELNLGENGTFTYKLNKNIEKNITEIFSYELSDGNGKDEATITITVTPTPNNAPVANDDTFNGVAKNKPIILDVLNNDTDSDGDTLVFEEIGEPVHGQVVINGSFLAYAPDLGFSGNDQFSYTIKDGRSGEDSATVSITVVNTPPVAHGQSITTDQNTTLTISLQGTDSDNDTLTFTVPSSTVSEGTLTNNSGSVTYTPPNNFSGSDSFSFSVNDGEEVSLQKATVTITVTPTPNSAPVANNDTFVVAKNKPTPLDVLNNDTDSDGDTLVFKEEELGQPAHGQVVINGSFLTYSPSLGFSGSDQFSYTIKDGRSGENSATVSVNIVNTRPVAHAQTITTDQNTTLTISLQGADGDNDALTFTVPSTTVSGGTLTNNSESVTYTTPPNNFSGSDSFSFSVNDGEVSSQKATVTIVVNEINTAPTAIITPPPETTVYEGQELILDGSSSADDGEVVSYSWTSPGGNVTTNSSPSFSYTVPALGEGVSQELTFSLIVTDNLGLLSEPVEVTITAHDLPNVFFSPISYTVTEGGINSGSLVDSTVSVINVTVKLSGVNNGSTEVSYKTVDGNVQGDGTEGSDYVASNGVLVFSNTVDTATISISIVPDLDAENGSEFFYIELFNAKNVEIVGTKATINIVDDDGGNPNPNS